MDIIKELEGLDEKENIAERLGRERLPLVMWGAGEYAVEVDKYLRMKGIPLADVFVDDKYYSEGMIFNGMKVLFYSEVIEKYAKVNVILGNHCYEKIDSLKENKIVKEVFYLFSIYYGNYDKTPLSYIVENVAEFNAVYQLWEDEKSCDNYLAFLKVRVSGNIQYILGINETECTFFNNDVYKIKDNEVFLDVGAYDGDTIRMFLEENGGKYKRIYAVEPDNKSRNRLWTYIEEARLRDIWVTEKGAWSKNGTLVFADGNGRLSSVVEEDIFVEGKVVNVKPLDNLFEYSDHISMLKINYLKGVKEALQGAENILKVHRPKLSIAVGLDCRNIVDIPMLIKRINPDYKLYLRYNSSMLSSLMLYGIV